MMRIPPSPQHAHAPLRPRTLHAAGPPAPPRAPPKPERGGTDRVGRKGGEEWDNRPAPALVAPDVMVGKTRRATKSGPADAQNQIAGFLIVEAADIAAAAGLFQDHPHITVFPGDAIDVMPVVTGPPED